MAVAYGNSKNANSFWRFDNWKMWLYILVGLIVIFPLYRYVRNQLNKNKSTDEKNKNEEEKDKNLNNLIYHPEVTQSEADKITKRKDVQAAASDLAHHLGTKYSDVAWWSFLTPSGWTENDAEAAKILIYQQKNYSFLKRLYPLYTNKRDLTYDILKYLDAAELKEVKKRINLV